MHTPAIHMKYLSEKEKSNRDIFQYPKRKIEMMEYTYSTQFLNIIHYV